MTPVVGAEPQDAAVTGQDLASAPQPERTIYGPLEGLGHLLIHFSFWHFKLSVQKGFWRLLTTVRKGLLMRANAKPRPTDEAIGRASV